MKKSLIWGLAAVLLVSTMVLASCGSNTSATTTTTSAAVSTTTPTTQATTNSTTTQSTIVVPTGNTTSTVTTTTVSKNWWDATLGQPIYGGTLTQRVGQNFTEWDPYQGTSGSQGFAGFISQIFIGDYSVDPKIWDFSIGWLPSQYATAYMATAWELTNPYTVVIHLRQDIYWQNIAPASGRQFVASDVVSHYNRILGLGGMPKDPYFASVSGWFPLISVVATDKFTVQFNWTPGTSQVSILTIMQAGGADNSIECPEAVAQFADPNTHYITDWRKSIGTGPFILSDFVDSTSATYVRNPNYWGKDLRYGLQLPYLDSFKMLIIQNFATAEAAMRVGKIDAFDSMPVQDAQNMMKTNPEIVVKQKPLGNEYTLDPRNDVTPFNNLNVRIAMQHAIDIPTIASQYYQGFATPWPASLTSNQMGLGGWGVAYPDWPASTKAEYTYDPALAKKMLADAGYPNGFTTDCVLESDADLDLYNIVKGELAAIGINMTIQLKDPASWGTFVMTNHAYDALCARNQGLMGFNFDIYRQFMRYSSPTYGTNYILVNDPVTQKAYQDALAAPTFDALQKLLQNVNLYIATQHFAISLAQPSQFNMVQPWVKGNPGANTLGDAVSGSGFGAGTPLGVWVDSAMKKSLGK